jgi:hypothetical protein
LHHLQLLTSHLHIAPMPRSTKPASPLASSTATPSPSSSNLALDQMSVEDLLRRRQFVPAQLNLLRSKFEADKARIMQLRAQRKFRPM